MIRLCNFLSIFGSTITKSRMCQSTSCTILMKTHQCTHQEGYPSVHTRCLFPSTHIPIPLRHSIHPSDLTLALFGQDHTNTELSTDLAQQPRSLACHNSGLKIAYIKSRSLPNRLSNSSLRLELFHFLLPCLLPVGLRSLLPVPTSPSFSNAYRSFTGLRKSPQTEAMKALCAKYMICAVTHAMS
jgi:hypothetical protein